MKLAAITDEISMDLAHALNVMREYGCVAAELRGIWDVNITELPNDRLEEARAIVEKSGLPVCGVASPLYKCDVREGASGERGPMHQASARPLSQQLDLLRHCHKVGKMFGTDRVRMFAFWRTGELTDELLEEIVAAIADAVKYAEDNGLVLLMENEAACAVGTGHELGMLLARVNSPALKACWDPGNAFLAGERMPYPDGYDLVRNYLAHVHVKDAQILASGKSRFTVVGEGEVDYVGQFAALKADGYKGYISLETHYRPFAGTAEQASRLCLQALNKLLCE
jgi:sugar phosphate isomerase/epimerase